MATITPIPLGNGTLTASAAALFTVPGAGGRYIIKKAVFTNTDASARTITVHRVPSGGSATTANMVLQAFSVSSGQTYEATSLGNMVLTTGDSIQALASTTSVVNYFVSGLSA
jgi:hypothetical protein